jgi:hypothetical protein
MRGQAVITAVAALLAASTVRAQPMLKAGGGGGGMPDLSQIVGRPLPDPGMPPGTVSVRVARKLPANAVAGVEVSAIIKNAGGDLRKRVLKTDDGGRVLFEAVAAGSEFHAEVTVDGEKLETQTFTMPSTGGLRTMLIADLKSGGGAAPGGAAAAGAPAQGQGQGKDQRAFALGATVGSAEPDATLPVGTLELRLRDENDAPIANHPIVLGIVNKQSEIETRHAKSDAAGEARFTGLPVGKETGYAAVIDWRGLRLNTAPFAMPESEGMRAEIRALARTSDPAVITIGAGGRIVLQMREDALQVLEFAPLENTSDKMFDPGPGAFEIPLPREFVGAQPQENERKVEVRQDHGVAVHGAIVPKRSLLAAGDAERQANEVVFGFVLPYHGDTHVFSQPAPNGIGQLTLIIDQKIAGLTASGPGVGAREERTLGGHKYWVMPVAGVPAGGVLEFTISGLPSNETSGRWVAAVLSLLLLASAVAFARRPRTGPAARGSTVADRRARLVDKREALFTELVSLERAARSAGKPAPAAERRQLVDRLEQIYQDIAALNEGEPRAA